MGRVVLELLLSLDESLLNHRPRRDAFEESGVEWSFESLRVCRDVLPFIRGVAKSRGEGGSPIRGEGEGGGRKSDRVLGVEVIAVRVQRGKDRCCRRVHRVGKREIIEDAL